MAPATGEPHFIGPAAYAPTDFLDPPDRASRSVIRFLTMTGTFRDHFSGHAAEYADYRPTYPPALAAVLAEAAPGRTLALDCGGGPGQLSTLLAEHFEHVVATDASAGRSSRARRRGGGARWLRRGARCRRPRSADHRASRARRGMGRRRCAARFVGRYPSGSGASERPPDS